MNLMKNEYQYNCNFRKYVDEYCNRNRCTVDEAFCNEDVKRMFWRYTEIQRIGFTLEEINILLELLMVEQGKQALKNNESMIEKYETIKQKLHALTRNFRS